MHDVYLRIRRARSHEAHEVADVWLRSRAASIPAIPAPVHTSEEVHTWFSDVVLPTREVWVAEDDGVLVGVLVLDDDWIDQLYILPDYRGSGLGAELVNLAKQHRPQRLRLWTFQANQRACKFYERHGFIPVDTTEGDNEEAAPDVQYEWLPSVT